MATEQQQQSEQLTSAAWRFLSGIPRRRHRPVRAMNQELLRNLGERVIELPSEECPDSCLLEDTALVLDEVAVIGTEVRRRERKGVAPAIVKFRAVVRIEAPRMLALGKLRLTGCGPYWPAQLYATSHCLLARWH